MRARAVAVCFLPTPAMRRFLKTDAVGEHRHIAATPALRRFPRPYQLEMPLYTRASRIRVSLSAEREDMDPGCLVEASRTASILWAQRLGYLREHAGAADKAVLLKEHVRTGARIFTTLLLGARAEDTPRSNEWRLYVNASIETDA